MGGAQSLKESLARVTRCISTESSEHLEYPVLALIGRRSRVQGACEVNGGANCAQDKLQVYL